MEDAQFEAILKDPNKVLNMVRLFHQFLHVLDKQDAEKLFSGKSGNQTAGLGDKLDVKVTDAQGKIKKEVKQ